MGKAKHAPLGGNNRVNTTRLFTILNWDKIGEGIQNANTMEGETFYAIRIGRLGGVVVHREIWEEDIVVVEISDAEGNRTKDIRVWIGSVVFSKPEQLLELFMDKITEWGWI